MNIEDMNISIIQIWYFVNVVEAGGFPGAARYLNLTQSTIRKSIQALESNIKVQLFLRDGKNLLLTDAGKFLYEKWKKLLAEMDRDLAVARKNSGGNQQSIRIGTLDSHRSETYLLEITRRFFDAQPNCAFEIERIPTDVLRKKLLDHKLDVVFTVLYEIEYGYWPDCEYKVIQECPHLACMLASNPLAGREVVTVGDLAAMKLSVISTLYLPTYSQMVKELFQAAGIQPMIEYIAANANSQVYSLHEEHDIFICDQFHRDFGLPPLVYKPIAGTRSGIAMVWNRSDQRQELCDFLSLFA